MDKQKNKELRDWLGAGKGNGHERSSTADGDDLESPKIFHTHAEEAQEHETGPSSLVNTGKLSPHSAPGGSLDDAISKEEDGTKGKGPCLCNQGTLHEGLENDAVGTVQRELSVSISQARIALLVYDVQCTVMASMVLSAKGPLRNFDC